MTPIEQLKETAWELRNDILNAKTQAERLAREIGESEGATLKNMAAWYALGQYKSLFTAIEDIHTQLGKVDS